MSVSSVILEIVKNILEDMSTDISHQVASLSVKEVVTSYGILNEAVWCAAINVGAIENVSDGNYRRTFISANIGAMFAPKTKIITPVTFVSDYLKKFWAGIAYYSRDAVTRIKKLLAQFGLFQIEDRSEWAINPRLRERRANPMVNISLVRMLIFAFHCEQRLIADGWKVSISSEESNPEDKILPAHKAYTLLRIFKEAFQGGLDRFIGFIGEDRGFQDLDCEDSYFVDDNFVDDLGLEPREEVIAAVLREFNPEETSPEENPETQESQENPASSSPESSPEPETQAQTQQSYKTSTNYLIPVPPKTREQTISRQEWRDRFKKILPNLETLRENRSQSNSNSLANLSNQMRIMGAIPDFAWENTEAAANWWKVNSQGSNSWLLSHTPDYLLDRMFPF